MTSTVERTEDREHIIESILSKSKCRNCNRKMDTSIFIDLDSERPLQISWLCLPCSNMEHSDGRQDLSMAVPGVSRDERLDSVLYIAKSITDYAQSSNKLSALNDLLQIVATEGIRLSYLDLASTGTVLGGYFHCAGVPYIILDDGLKTAPMEHVQVLAEEIGRYFAYKTNASSNDEVFALRWAVKFLATVPDMIG